MMTSSQRRTERNEGLEKKYVVVCDDCSFERSIEGRQRAERITRQHKQATDHEVLALEFPPNK